MYFFYFKAFSHVMGYHDGTQNFTIRKYDILAFKWRVLSIFSIPGSKVIPKKQKDAGEIPRVVVLFYTSFPDIRHCTKPILGLFLRKTRADK